MNRMLRAAIRSSTRAGEPRATAVHTGRSGEYKFRRPTRKRDLDRYDGLARFFHWIFAAGIIYASVMGYTIAHIARGPAHDFLSRLNMSIATVLIVLFPLRVGWKQIRIEPRALPGVSVRQHSVARGIHTVMYVAIFAVLASGFLMVPNGYSFFGLVEIHTPFAKGPLTDEFFAMHRASCALLAGLVALHVLAVVKHQWIARNNVLRRMV
jgi:superoxide oxidase